MLMLHAVEATNNGASSLKIFFPDTGVLVLSVRRYQNLAADTSMAIGTRVIHRNIKLRPRYNMATRMQQNFLGCMPCREPILLGCLPAKAIKHAERS